MAAGTALMSAYTPPGVEKGVTGKEKRFQQNRAFGPGPIKPYLNQPWEQRGRYRYNGQNFHPGSLRNPSARTPRQETRAV